MSNSNTVQKSGVALNHVKALTAESFGRNLVPFFDDGGEVNEDLRSDQQQPNEDLDIRDLGARVWNPEGYWEYPTYDDQPRTQPKPKRNTSGKKTRNNQRHSPPIQRSTPPLLYEEYPKTREVVQHQSIGVTKSKKKGAEIMKMIGGKKANKSSAPKVLSETHKESGYDPHGPPIVNTLPFESPPFTGTVGNIDPPSPLLLPSSGSQQHRNHNQKGNSSSQKRKTKQKQKNSNNQTPVEPKFAMSRLFSNSPDPSELPRPHFPPNPKFGY